MEFIEGNEYRRREIHHEYGGQMQGGISTPAKHPLIFLFTGEQGEIYGYHDGFQNDGLFWYTGEGQVGDMEFVRGNLTIRNSPITKKDIHVFEYLVRGSGMVRYLGMMDYVGHHLSQAPDIHNNLRDVIIFELAFVDEHNLTSSTSEQSPVVLSENQLWRQSIEELREIALTSTPRSERVQERRVNVYLRSAAVKIYAQQRADGICEGCHEPAPFTKPNSLPYLETHHINRIADGGPDTPVGVAALCPNCHRRAHYSSDSKEYNNSISKYVFKLEQDQ